MLRQQYKRTFFHLRPDILHRATGVFRWSVLFLLLLLFSSCSMLQRNSGPDSPTDFEPLVSKMALMTVSAPEPVTLPFLDIERTFRERLEQIFYSVVALPPGFREYPGRPGAEIFARTVEEAREQFLLKHDLDSDTIRTLTADTGGEFFGVLLIRTYGQKWAGMNKVTEVGLSFVVYTTEDGRVISRRSSFVEQQESLRGQTYEAALEKSTRLVLEKTAEDLRKYLSQTNVFVRVPDPKVQAVEKEPPARDIGQWLSRKWKAFLNH